jgi:hypothetical protein
MIVGLEIDVDFTVQFGLIARPSMSACDAVSVWLVSRCSRMQWSRVSWSLSTISIVPNPRDEIHLQQSIECKEITEIYICTNSSNCKNITTEPMNASMKVVTAQYCPCRY